MVAPHHSEFAFVPFLIVSGRKPRHSLFSFVQHSTLWYNSLNTSTFPSLTTGGTLLHAPHNTQLRGYVMLHIGPHNAHYTQEWGRHSAFLPVVQVPTQCIAWKLPSEMLSQEGLYEETMSHLQVALLCVHTSAFLFRTQYLSFQKKESAGLGGTPQLYQQQAVCPRKVTQHLKPLHSRVKWR